ncbi:carbon-nitrogen hydrolase family protein [Halobacillus litoralis]|uniref:carbon-nitrogen hydrolase family protein n=1 Tax=Halobacillus litoralis TaxID=45668 RepID=UPI001CFCF474|nr:carbon-nitrogen hydrolase family protein [Halobacillus litoralis]
MSVTIALSQHAYTPGDKDANIRRMEEDIERCMNKNVDLIVFPELAATGYFLSPALHDVAEEKFGPVYERMSTAARKGGVYLLYGYVERASSGDLYNSTVLLDHNGEFVAHYRKIHLTPPEKEFFKGGEDPVVVQTPIGKIALMICWDLAFPEYAAYLSKQNVELILAPSAWESPYENPFASFASARAIDTTAYVAACNHTGDSGRLSFFGQSRVYSPDGTVISEYEQIKDKLVVTTIDYRTIIDWKDRFFTMNNDRRPEVFERKDSYANQKNC